MYERHRVLHRGVSCGNILLLLAPAYVALIDFDLAISADPSDHGRQPDGDLRLPRGGQPSRARAAHPSPRLRGRLRPAVALHGVGA